MPPLRSRTVTHGRNMAGARALLRATGVAREDLGKPIVAVANSFTEFVPGHVHLREVGQVVAEAVYAAGAVPREFNTIAVDDGIAMGHGGMLYSLPSRELIADSVEYMVNAHCADALVCISNCDKITPGHADGRAPAEHPDRVRVRRPDGGRRRPRRAARPPRAPPRLDLIDPMIASADPSVSDERLAELEEAACPTCGSCSGMFTANSMNCLTEAIGLALPGNGTTLATHTARRDAVRPGRPAGGRAGQAVLRAGRRVGAAAVDRHPRRVRERDGAGRGHGRLHQHDPAPARRRPRGAGRVRPEGDRRAVPPGAVPVQGGARAAATTWRTCTGPAASRPSSVSWTGPGCSTPMSTPCTAPRCGRSSTAGTSARPRHRAGARTVPRRARRGPDHQAVLAERPVGRAGQRPGRRLHQGPPARLHHRRRARRAVRQPGAGGRDREDRRRAGGAVALRRPGPGVREPGRRGGRHPERRGHGR